MEEEWRITWKRNASVIKNKLRGHLKKMMFSCCSMKITVISHNSTLL